MSSQYQQDPTESKFQHGYSAQPIPEPVQHVHLPASAFIVSSPGFESTTSPQQGGFLPPAVRPLIGTAQDLSSAYLSPHHPPLSPHAFTSNQAYLDDIGLPPVFGQETPYGGPNAPDSLPPDAYNPSSFLNDLHDIRLDPLGHATTPFLSAHMGHPATTPFLGTINPSPSLSSAVHTQHPSLTPYLHPVEGSSISRKERVENPTDMKLPNSVSSSQNVAGTSSSLYNTSVLAIPDTTSSQRQRSEQHAAHTHTHTALKQLSSHMALHYEPLTDEHFSSSKSPTFTSMTVKNDEAMDALTSSHRLRHLSVPDIHHPFQLLTSSSIPPPPAAPLHDTPRSPHTGEGYHGAQMNDGIHNPPHGSPGIAPIESSISLLDITTDHTSLPSSVGLSSPSHSSRHRIFPVKQQPSASDAASARSSDTNSSHGAHGTGPSTIDPAGFVFSPGIHHMPANDPLSQLSEEVHYPHRSGFSSSQSPSFLPFDSLYNKASSAYPREQSGMVQQALGGNAVHRLDLSMEPSSSSSSTSNSTHPVLTSPNPDADRFPGPQVDPKASMASSPSSLEPRHHHQSHKGASVHRFGYQVPTPTMDPGTPYTCEPTHNNTYPPSLTPLPPSLLTENPLADCLGRLIIQEEFNTGRHHDGTPPAPLPMIISALWLQLSQAATTVKQTSFGSIKLGTSITAQLTSQDVLALSYLLNTVAGSIGTDAFTRLSIEQSQPLANLMRSALQKAISTRIISLYQPTQEVPPLQIKYSGNNNVPLRSYASATPPSKGPHANRSHTTNGTEPAHKPTNYVLTLQSESETEPKSKHGDGDHPSLQQDTVRHDDTPGYPVNIMWGVLIPPHPSTVCDTFMSHYGCRLCSTCTMGPHSTQEPSSQAKDSARRESPSHGGKPTSQLAALLSYLQDMLIPVEVYCQTSYYNQRHNPTVPSGSHGGSGPTQGRMNSPLENKGKWILRTRVFIHAACLFSSQCTPDIFADLINSLVSASLHDGDGLQSPCAPYPGHNSPHYPPYPMVMPYYGMVMPIPAPGGPHYPGYQYDYPDLTAETPELPHTAHGHRRHGQTTYHAYNRYRGGGHPRSGPRPYPAKHPYQRAFGMEYYPHAPQQPHYVYNQGDVESDPHVAQQQRHSFHQRFQGDYYQQHNPTNDDALIQYFTEAPFTQPVDLAELDHIIATSKSSLIDFCKSQLGSRLLQYRLTYYSQDCDSGVNPAKHASSSSSSSTQSKPHKNDGDTNSIAINQTKDVAYITYLFTHILPHTTELVLHFFGNYLIQRLVPLLTPGQLFQLVLALSHNIHEISKDRQGTRGIQKIIESCTCDELWLLLFSSLLGDQHGDGTGARGVVIDTKFHRPHATQTTRSGTTKRGAEPQCQCKCHCDCSCTDDPNSLQNRYKSQRQTVPRLDFHQSFTSIDDWKHFFESQQHANSIHAVNDSKPAETPIHQTRSYEIPTDLDFTSLQYLDYMQELQLKLQMGGVDGKNPVIPLPILSANGRIYTRSYTSNILSTMCLQHVARACRSAAQLSMVTPHEGSAAGSTLAPGRNGETKLDRATMACHKQVAFLRQLYQLEQHAVDRMGPLSVLVLQYTSGSGDMSQSTPHSGSVRVQLVDLPADGIQVSTLPEIIDTLCIPPTAMSLRAYLDSLTSLPSPSSFTSGGNSDPGTPKHYQKRRPHGGSISYNYETDHVETTLVIPSYIVQALHAAFLSLSQDGFQQTFTMLCGDATLAPTIHPTGASVVHLLPFLRLHIADILLFPIYSTLRGKRGTNPETEGNPFRSVPDPKNIPKPVNSRSSTDVTPSYTGRKPPNDVRKADASDEQLPLTLVPPTSQKKTINSSAEAPSIEDYADNIDYRAYLRFDLRSYLYLYRTIRLILNHPEEMSAPSISSNVHHSDHSLSSSSSSLRQHHTHDAQRPHPHPLVDSCCSIRRTIVDLASHTNASHTILTLLDTCPLRLIYHSHLFETIYEFLYYMIRNQHGVVLIKKTLSVIPLPLFFHFVGRAIHYSSPVPQDDRADAHGKHIGSSRDVRNAMAPTATMEEAHQAKLLHPTNNRNIQEWNRLFKLTTIEGAESPQSRPWSTSGHSQSIRDKRDNKCSPAEYIDYTRVHNDSDRGDEKQRPVPAADTHTTITLMNHQFGNYCFQTIIDRCCYGTIGASSGMPGQSVSSTNTTRTALQASTPVLNGKSANAADTIDSGGNIAMNHHRTSYKAIVTATVDHKDQKSLACGRPTSTNDATNSVNQGAATSAGGPDQPANKGRLAMNSGVGGQHHSSTNLSPQCKHHTIPVAVMLSTLHEESRYGSRTMDSLLTVQTLIFDIIQTHYRVLGKHKYGINILEKALAVGQPSLREKLYNKLVYGSFQVEQPQPIRLTYPPVSTQQNHGIGGSNGGGGGDSTKSAASSSVDGDKSNGSGTSPSVVVLSSTRNAKNGTVRSLIGTGMPSTHATPLTTPNNHDKGTPHRVDSADQSNRHSEFPPLQSHADAAVLNPVFFGNYRLYYTTVELVCDVYSSYIFQNFWSSFTHQQQRDLLLIVAGQFLQMSPPIRKRWENTISMYFTATPCKGPSPLNAHGLGNDEPAVPSMCMGDGSASNHYPPSVSLTTLTQDEFFIWLKTQYASQLQSWHQYNRRTSSSGNHMNSALSFHQQQQQQQYGSDGYSPQGRNHTISDKMHNVAKPPEVDYPAGRSISSTRPYRNAVVGDGHGIPSHSTSGNNSHQQPGFQHGNQRCGNLRYGQPRGHDDRPATSTGARHSGSRYRSMQQQGSTKSNSGFSHDETASRQGGTRQYTNRRGKHPQNHSYSDKNASLSYHPSSKRDESSPY